MRLRIFAEPGIPHRGENFLQGWLPPKPEKGRGACGRYDRFYRPGGKTLGQAPAIAKALFNLCVGREVKLFGCRYAGILQGCGWKDRSAAADWYGDIKDAKNYYIQNGIAGKITSACIKLLTASATARNWPRWTLKPRRECGILYGSFRREITSSAI